MAARRSAGLLFYRRLSDGIEVLIGHMGGPLWSRKEAAAWSIPKGEYGDDEAPLDAARREFHEELGVRAPDVDLVLLGDVRQRSGKVVTVWAGDCPAGAVDLDAFMPGTFTMEWPRGSGRLQEFAEIDRVAWVPTSDARRLLVQAQVEFLERLARHLHNGPG